MYLEVYFHQFWEQCRILFLPKGSRLQRSTTFIALVFLSAAFSPLGGFVFSLILLVFFHETLEVRQRRSLGISAVLFGALCIASRATLRLPEDDMNSYYSNIYLLSENRSFFTFLHGEFLFYTFIKLLFTIYPNFTPNGFIFVISATIGILFWLWLEFYAAKNFPTINHGLLVASGIFFFNFFLTTQLSRQMFASTLLLIAMIPTNKLLQVILFLAAATTHLAIIPTALVWLACRRFPKGTFVTILFFGPIFFFAGRMIINTMITLFQSSPILAYKMGFYAGNIAGFSTADLYYFNHILVICLGVLVAKSAQLALHIRSFILTFSVIYFSLLPYPLMSLRIPLILTAIISGGIFFYLFRAWKTLYATIFTVLVLYQGFQELTVSRKDLGGMDTWFLYSPLESKPFYYLQSLFTTGLNLTK